MVAPLVGAWIEIPIWDWDKQDFVTSLPSWERGLKLVEQYIVYNVRGVAPLVGAWIEISSGK